MAFKIVNYTFVNGEYRTAVQPYYKTIADRWLGAGASAAVATWGAYYALINPVLAAAGIAQIPDGATDEVETASMNALNDAEIVLRGFGFLSWHNADRADLVTLSGSQVTSWKDSFFAYDVVQATSSARPLYSATSFNGDPAIYFDGSDDFLNMESQPFPSGAAPSEIWMVAMNDTIGSEASTRRGVAYGGVTNNDSRFVTRAPNAGVSNAYVNAGTGGAFSTKGAPAMPLTTRHLIRTIITATGIDIAIDGTLQGGGPTAAVPATGATRFRIGASTSGIGFWQGPQRDVLAAPQLAANPALYATNYFLPRRKL